MTAILENIPLSQIAESHLQSLQNLRVPEGPRLDYKAELKMSSQGDKKELCKDVSSLAHSQGGYILFGVAEENAQIKDIPGIDFGDELQQQFEQIMMAGITPRLQGFQHHVVALENGKSVLVVHVVPDAQLHQVKYDDDRFYRRVGVTISRMSPEDIATFLKASPAEQPSDKFQELVQEYHDQLQSNTYNFKIPMEALCALVISPEVPSLSLDLSSPAFRWSSPFAPLFSSGWNTEISGRSIYAVSAKDEDGAPTSVAEWNESGQIKAFNATLLSSGKYYSNLPKGCSGSVPSLAIEERTIRAVGDYLSKLDELGVNSPYLVNLSLLRVKGFYLAVDHRFDSGGARLFQDNDILPDTVRFASPDEYADPATIGRKFRPVFDLIWREFGYPRSPHYDDDGNWRYPR